MKAAAAQLDVSQTKMAQRDAFDVMSLLAEWLSAIGTVGAVIVALVLARLQNKPSVRLTVGVFNLAPHAGTIDERLKAVRIGVVNTGSRDIVIRGLFWRVGLLSRQAFIQIPGSHHLTAKLPARLAPSESADFLFGIDEFASGTEPLTKAIRERNRLLSRVRVGVYLATGEEYSAPPDASVWRLLTRQLE